MNGIEDPFVLADHDGHVVAFVGPFSREKVPTKYGRSEAVACRAVTCSTCLRLWPDVLIFASVIVGKLLDPDAGYLVVGRIERATRGDHRPWLLRSVEEDQRLSAERDVELSRVLDVNGGTRVDEEIFSLATVGLGTCGKCKCVVTIMVEHMSCDCSCHAWFDADGRVAPRIEERQRAPRGITPKHEP